MLDKQAEKVLKIAIDEYKGDTEASIEVYPDKVKVKYTHLNSICTMLYEQGYCGKPLTATSQPEPVIISLEHKGAAYFKTKRQATKEYWKKFFMSKTFDIIVSIITTILTTMVLSA